MSVVPLMFRDWWDDWETPFRPSRLIDQQFGTGLRRDELMSSFWNSPSPLLRHGGYIRPWAREFKRSESANSTMHFDNDKFQVILDVQQFTPKEIAVKSTDKYIVVEGKHEEKPDEHGFISRHFVRRYQLPNGVNPNDITSTLSSDGVLTVTAPLRHALKSTPERFVPITHTGASAGASRQLQRQQSQAAAEDKAHEYCD